MQTKTITYRDSEVTAELTVARSNYRMGLIHSSLIDSARERLFPKKAEGQESPSHYSEDFWLELFSYPALCAGTTGGTIKVGESETKLDLHRHLTWVQYEDFPAEFITQWENAVFELNPHWLPGKVEEEQKKVVGESTES